MEDFLVLFSKYGYGILAAVVFLESIGMPVPAALALLAGGVACAWHVMHPVAAIGSAVLAMLLGDWLLFLFGRHAGWGLLAFLCRVSINPETCILRSAEAFYKRGKATLLFAKFVPGINTMAPPLAGSMKMQPSQFFLYDSAGTALYVLSYGLLGFLFSDFARKLARGLATAGHIIEFLFVLAIIAYTFYRIWAYRRQTGSSIVPRVQVSELARMLSTEEKNRILILDVRSHGYYDSGAQRILGSIRFEPNKLEEEMDSLPRDKHIYLYCT